MHNYKSWTDKAKENPSFRYTCAWWNLSFWVLFSNFFRWIADQANKPALRAQGRLDWVIINAMEAGKHPDDTPDKVHCPRCGKVLLHREWIENIHQHREPHYLVQEPIFPFGIGSEQLCGECYIKATPTA